MKKLPFTRLLVFALVFAAASCTFTDQEMVFAPSLHEEPSSLGEQKKLQIKVEDQRTEKEIIGKKVIGDQVVKIGNRQNLGDLIKKQISAGLKKKGFQIVDKASPKTLQINLVDINYQANRAFPAGHSETQIIYQVIIKNNLDNSVYQKDYKLGSEKDHFIMPREITDSENINAIFQEMLGKILDNNEIIVALTK